MSVHFTAMTPQDLFEHDRKVLAPRRPRPVTAPAGLANVGEGQGCTVLPNLDYAVTSPTHVSDRQSLTRAEFVQRLAERTGVELITVD